MSILNYFQKSGARQQNVDMYFPPAEVIGASYVEYINITESLNTNVGERKRTTYKEEEKMRIAKYANVHTTANAVKHFKAEFPNLKEASIRRWLSTYRKHLNAKVAPGDIVISEKRGRPLSLPEELDFKLQKFLMNIRKAGGIVNQHVVKGVLMGFIKSDMEKYSRQLEFSVTRGWLQHLYARMNYSQRMATTSRPTITKSIWEEVRLKFLHAIVNICIEYQVPDELVINIDQTPSKYVATGKVTMAEKGSRHVSRKGSDDKRQITATLSETLSGKILPFQLIYKGKTKRSIPSSKFPEGFLLSANPRHWSNEAETIKLLDGIIKPYIEKTKELLHLNESQKSCIVWDAFKKISHRIVCDIFAYILDPVTTHT